MHDSTEMILVLDADYLVSPEILKEAIPEFENAHVGLVSKNCREWIIADLAIGVSKDAQNYIKMVRD